MTGLHQGQRQGPPTSPFWLGEKGDQKPMRVSGMGTKKCNMEQGTEERSSEKAASERGFGEPWDEVEGAQGRGKSKGSGSGEEPHCNLRQRKEAAVLAATVACVAKSRHGGQGPQPNWARRLGFI